MKLFSISFRSKEETAVDAVHTWEVRWKSRHGEFYGDVRDEVRVFVDESSAKEFASALHDAFKLIRHSSGSWVSVKASES